MLSAAAWDCALQLAQIATDLLDARLHPGCVGRDPDGDGIAHDMSFSLWSIARDAAAVSPPATGIATSAESRESVGCVGESSRVSAELRSLLGIRSTPNARAIATAAMLSGGPVRRQL